MDVAEEPEEPDVPWALQLVALVARPGPTADPGDLRPPDPTPPDPNAPRRSGVPEPTVVDLTTAAAVASVRMLADPRSLPGGRWAEAVARWDAGPVRKLVRRARGAAWERVLGLDGLTVAHGTAVVHAVPPAPVRPLPPELVKLQVSGLVAGGTRPATWRAAPGWPGVRIALTPESGLTAGKLAAQAGHAAHLAWRAMDAGRRARWEAAGLAVEVAFPDPPRWASLLTEAHCVVRDGGYTETVPGQVTALSFT